MHKDFTFIAQCRRLNLKSYYKGDRKKFPFFILRQLVPMVQGYNIEERKDHMESYVEISFLWNAITIYLSMRLAAYWCAKPISLRKVQGYSIAISICGCLFFPYADLLVLLIEVLFFLNSFRYVKKVYLLGLAFRWFCYFSMFAWYRGSFHNGIYFVPIDAQIWEVWLCYALLWIMLRYKWKNLLARGEYVYCTRLKVNDQEMVCKGYLDSGNLLCHKGIPVVFLDAKYSSYFDAAGIELVVMNTIQSNGTIRCYPCQLSIDGCPAHKVYVSCERKLKLPFDCEVLLNMNAMTLG